MEYIFKIRERLPANPEEPGMSDDLILFQAVVFLGITL